MKKLLGIVVLGLLFCNTSFADSLRVVDGDTIVLNGEKIRFSGIDTPETTYYRKYKQICYLDNQKIYCGEISKNKLIEKIGKNKINCIREEKKDVYGRTLAECFVNDESLSSYLVKNGYAFDFKKYSKKKYDLDQAYAKENKLGLWSMKFLYPWDWRSKIRKYRESVPDWMDELGVSELGETLWSKEIAAQNQQADVILRTNTLNISKEMLQKKLRTENVITELIPNHPDALRLTERANVFKTEAFHNGFFEVQDASSQLVAAFLEVAPGMKVVDTCAGAGGKTLHLASLMENKGQIIAMDIYESKLKKLKVRARRNKAHNIDMRVIDSTKPIKKLYNKADRVLIDAPCSGLGVIRRNPDSKWKLQPEFIENIKKIQQEVLQSYSKMVKPGGKMVYATCSILPSENRKQVDKFLTSESGKEFTFVNEKNVFAHISGFDGFYMALLEKK